MKINQLILGIGYWSYKYRTHGIGFEKNRNTGAGIINNIYNNDNYLVIVDIA